MSRPRGAWREGGLAIVIFLLLSGCFLWRPLLSGDRGVFLPNDIPFTYDFGWRSPQSPPPRNPLLSDVTLYYYPYVHYAVGEMAQGHLPLWNPLILGGIPFYATAQAALFDPINLLSRAFGDAAGWVIGAWLRLALAGLGVYGLLRALGRGPLAGVAGGIVFMYSGFLVAWLNYSVTTTLVWFPLVLWTTLRLAQTGRLAWVGLLAFALAAQFYGGHPETSFVIGLTWAAYALVLLGQTARRAGFMALRRLALRMAAAAGLGLAAGLGQLLPLLDMVAQSEILVDRNAGLRVHHLAALDAWIYSASLLVVSFVPNFSGTPTEGNYWYDLTLGNFNEQISYCGLLALGLAAVGLRRWRHSQRAFWGLAGALAWALLIHLPVVDLINRLPGFSQGTGVRWAALFSLAVAVLAGCGVEALVPAAPVPAGLRRTAMAWLAGGAVLLASVLAFAAALDPGGWQPAWADAARVSHAALVALFRPDHATIYWPFLFLAAGGAVLLALARRRGPHPTWALPGARLLLLGLLAADGLTFGSAYNPVIPAAQNIPPTALTRWLAAHLGDGRLAARGTLLNPNLGMVVGLRDLRGYEDLTTRRFTQIFGATLLLGATPDAGLPTITLTPGDKNRLDLAAVRYVLALRPVCVAGQCAAFVDRAQFPPIHVYENSGALPRAYGVYGAEVLSDPNDVPARLDSPAFDPHRVVLLEAPVPAPLAPPAGTFIPPTVRFTADAPEHVALAATFAAPGYLVLADAWAPGWEARVDGVPAPIWRANGVFRAVALPPGGHTVTFDYRPPLVYASLAVSVAALLMIGALGLLDARRRPA